jgi:hypothetical protein
MLVEIRQCWAFFGDTPEESRNGCRQAMYPGVFKHRPNIVPFECIAHLRRYVLEAVKADEAQALPLLKDIRAVPSQGGLAICGNL